MKKWWPYLLLLLLVLIGADTMAQCSMCKAVVESNNTAANGYGVRNAGQNINNGILYLMTMVYVVLLTLAYIFFKDQIKEKLRELRA